jgi:hypothetical protein
MMQTELGALASMMIPDALTPQQFYDGRRADSAVILPIKRLMLAVLEDAMRCYQGYFNARTATHRRLFAEAEAWVWDRKADGPFAFDTICETLGINTECMRNSLREWRIQQLNGTAPPRLARRSPVTREGRISSPFTRRRRHKSGKGATALSNGKHSNGNGNGSGVDREFEPDISQAVIGASVLAAEYSTSNGVD